MSDCEQKNLITVEWDGERHLFRAEYPFKMYAAYGLTEADALGRLLQIESVRNYLGIEIKRKSATEPEPGTARTVGGPQ